MRKINLKNIVWEEGKHYVSWNLNTGVSLKNMKKNVTSFGLQEALELYFEDIPFSQAAKIERPDIVSSELQYA